MESAVFTTGLILAVILIGAQANPVSQGRLPTMPPSCSGQRYCTERHDHYPQDRVDEMLKQYRVTLGHPHESSIGRDGYDSDYQNDCEKNSTYSYIYEIEDDDRNVRVVVQAENFKQQVRLEYCLHPGQLKSRTTHFDVVHLQNNEIFCVTERTEYSFLVLSLDGKKLESVRSKNIPVNCACRLHTS